ncbi:MAG TPA: dNTP triphosphohydrolase [Chloroflexota bacterium]|nr:dNTP triphosphohydrolase [Chloroflexota bacterium]
MVAYSPADAERQTSEAGKPGDERDPWEIDRARILHSAAFRRLQRKTQVFAPAEGDFFRTRLTHSIEVSQIAKGVALRLGADPTLCEAASLAHDIGHPPFGHAGESVLNACMAQAGGFEGNAQNLRVIATLEVKSDAYLGLNLTRATLDALLKYKRSHSEALAAGEGKFFYDDDLALVDWVCQGRRDGTTSFECQIMDWADEVAYSVHDVEDGMWADLITLPRLRDERSRAAVQSAVPEVGQHDVEAVAQEMERVLLVSGSRQRKAALKTWSSFAIYELVRAATAEPAGEQGRGPRYGCRLRVDAALVVKSRILKAISEELVFRHPRVAAVQPRASRIVGGLFEALEAKPELIPEDYRASDPARAACDYISGMTDDYAERVYKSLSR